MRACHGAVRDPSSILVHPGLHLGVHVGARQGCADHRVALTCPIPIWLWVKNGEGDSDSDRGVLKPRNQIRGKGVHGGCEETTKECAQEYPSTANNDTRTEVGFRLEDKWGDGDWKRSRKKSG